MTIMETGRVPVNPAKPAARSTNKRLPEKISTLLTEIKAASRSKDLAIGKKLHAKAVETGIEEHLYVASSLVDMYAKCGSITDARRIFDKMPNRDVVSWTALILGYAQNGDGGSALELFELMQRAGCNSNAQTFVAALKACSTLAANEESKRSGGRFLKMLSLEKAMALHDQAAKLGFDSDIFIASTLVDLYAKCGTMEYAREVFDKVSTKSSVLWNTLILGYAQNGQGMLAFKFFSFMLSTNDSVPVRSTFLAVLKACSALAEIETGRILGGKIRKLQALETGMAIHALAARSEPEMDLRVASSLIDMYCKAGSIGDAKRVFDRIKNRDTVSWNSIVLGYAQNGDGSAALRFFETMIAEGCVPIRSSFLAALEACRVVSQVEECQIVGGKVAKLVSLETAMVVHRRAVSEQRGIDVMVANTLIDVYSNCGSMTDAQRVFDGMPQRNLVSWTVLMFGYSQNDQAKMVIELFASMRSSQPASWIPSSQTYVAVIQAAADMAALSIGRKLHGEVCRIGLEMEAHIQSSLVDLYGKSGNTIGSRLVFDSVSDPGIEMWSSVMAGYSRQGDHARVFEIFDSMLDAGIRPNAITFLSLQIACSRGGLVDKAEVVFEEMKSRFGIRPGIEHYHCLIDLLGRANRIEKAAAVAEGMPLKATAVTWMTVLAACRRWKNVEIGKRAFDAVMRLDRDGDRHSAAYVLMAEIYEAN